MKRCFVISPIGQEGSPTRKHADDVFDYIIQPAMKRCGIKAFRSDHLDKPGKISEQMFHAIGSSDLCIAVLTDKNPNVFYELAVAQHARRPVIILIQKDQQLPFDVFDLRCVAYDLDIRSYRDRTYIDAVVNHVKEYEAAGWQTDDIFSTYGRTPDKTDGQQFFETSGVYGTDDDWLELLRQTHTAFDVMGIGLSSWRRTAGFGKAVVEKAKEGCSIRVLLVDKDNPILRSLINDTKLAGLVDDIERSNSFYQALARQCPNNIKIRHLMHGMPHFFLTRTDLFAVAVLYLSAQKWTKGPLWRCDAGTGLYRVVSNEFNELWDTCEARTKKQSR